MENADKNHPPIYNLYGVVVYCEGEVDNRRYFVYVRPEKDANYWLKFDEEMVYQTTLEKVLSVSNLYFIYFTFFYIPKLRRFSYFV